ncbi:trypsin-like serine peptidase [Streptomyces sp. DW26H14]|uniref:trypsin-like serine peptidase n=1 Tax=Streptomyces sp. DW26H14 TaxID=3435395 RepID=UPI00403E1B81
MSVSDRLRRVRRVSPILLAPVATSFLLFGATAAQAAPSSGGVATHTVSDADQQAARAYWTPQRIAALTTPGSDNPPLSAPDGAPWTAGGAIGRATGRLFFTDHGEDVSCTATLVNSANHSTLVTAGHCLNDTDLLGDDDQWNGEELFIPGYHDGQAPYGTFPVRTLVADSTWLQNDQVNAAKFDAYDQAFAVVGRNESGQSPQDAVGTAEKIGFDVAGGQKVYEFGYPRAADDPAREGLPEYTGQRLAFCEGQAQQYPGTSDVPEPRGLWGSGCVMGGGSSGGPRLAGFAPATGAGTVVGVNTQGGYMNAAGQVCEDADASGCHRDLVGPQFTTAITEPLYQAAQR